MNLERYRTPSGIQHGEWIELPGTDAKFLVKLPAKSNRLWQREMLRLISAAGVRLDSSGEVDMTHMNTDALMSFKDARLTAFARVCIIEGPPGFDCAQLLEEYWPALEKLFELAEFRASEQMLEADNAVGES
jgi:hypothetical protein